MDRRTQGALLMAVAGVTLRLGLTDAALAYVKAGLRPLLAVAGVVLAVLGGLAIVASLREDAWSARAPTTSGTRSRSAAIDAVDGPPGGTHAGEHGPAVGWLLVLPLLALLLIAPPPLGAFAAGRRSADPAEPARLSYPALPPPTDGAVELSLPEYRLRALYDDNRSLEGARVRLSGFVTPADDAEGYLLTRFILSCCAADGIAIHVAVRGDPAARSADTWLKIEGTWAPGGAGTGAGQHPVLMADQVAAIQQPAQPYEY